MKEDIRKYLQDWFFLLLSVLLHLQLWLCCLHTLFTNMNAKPLQNCNKLSSNTQSMALATLNHQAVNGLPKICGTLTN